MRFGRVVIGLALAGTVAACSGEITFGRDRAGGDASTARPDAAALPADSGAPGPDAGTPSPDGGFGGVDAGCVRTFPATWPFARDKATYQQKLWTWASMQRPISCNTAGACHGATIRPPLMPDTDASLDNPATLSTAIDELWDSIKPKAQAPPNQAIVTSSIIFVHRNISEGGKGASPVYNLGYNPPGQLDFVQALVNASGQCQ